MCGQETCDLPTTNFNTRNRQLEQDVDVLRIPLIVFLIVGISHQKKIKTTIIDAAMVS